MNIYFKISKRNIIAIIMLCAAEVMIAQNSEPKSNPFERLANWLANNRYVRTRITTIPSPQISAGECTM